MKYKISNLKTKSWNDKTYKQADLIDPNGELFQVSAWNGEFDDKDYIECELEKNSKGYWAMVTPKKVAGANFKTQQMEKVMERKDQSISKFQDNKEFSIKTSSTLSNAVQLAIANFKQNPNSLRSLEEEFQYWRKYLWDNWDISNTDMDVPF